MLELTATKLVQYTGDETGFIKVELVNKPYGKMFLAYAKVESSYAPTFLTSWNNKFEQGITYDEPTKSFLFSDSTVAKAIV
jgi:hypothetical protein